MLALVSTVFLLHFEEWEVVMFCPSICRWLLVCIVLLASKGAVDQLIHGNGDLPHRKLGNALFFYYEWKKGLSWLKGLFGSSGLSSTCSKNNSYCSSLAFRAAPFPCKLSGFHTDLMVPGVWAITHIWRRLVSDADRLDQPTLNQLMHFNIGSAQPTCLCSAVPLKLTASFSSGEINLAF